MTRTAAALRAGFRLSFAVASLLSPAALAPAAEPSPDDLLAVDVVLLPDAAMVKFSEEANALLRQNYPQGYTLGAEQVAHITLVQRYVRAKNLPALQASLAKIFAADDPLQWELTATGFKHGIWAGLAITTITVKPTPQLMRLHEEVTKALEPVAVARGTKSAFALSRELPKIDDEIVAYVENFVPKSSGENFDPHITVGVAREDFVKQLEADAFQPRTFKASAAALYQLGNFGTAQKKLWSWPPR